MQKSQTSKLNYPTSMQAVDKKLDGWDTTRNTNEKSKYT